MIHKLNLLLLCIMASFEVKAQESKLTPLHGNAQIIEYRKHLPKENTHINNRTQSTSTVSLLLPFYDDFSYAGPYPDSTKWQNSQSVYVNHTKAIAPPTLGVATFDGLNKYGYPYIDNQTINCNGTGNPNTHAPSDTLTSLPIRLDSLGPFAVDSIYLSFYYQPMGYYEAPGTNDYLYLDFYSPLTTTWNTVWSLGGSTPVDSAWHLVMMPIRDTSYLHKNFQFRFRNISAGSGDVDHWHIDVVRLKNSSFYNDTIFADKSFVYDLPSTLKNYTQMPYEQFTGGADMKTHIGACLRNNGNDINNLTVSTQYSSYDNTHGTYISPLHPLASANLPYYYGTGGGYSTVDSVVKPALNFVYPAPLTDTISYTMKLSLYHNTNDPVPTNDTISFTQKFNRFYSYDDGSAEAGYGACSEKDAVKYKLNVADTLRAMDVFFDPIYDVKSLELTSFRIAVWGDNNGLPGNIIYADTIDRYPYFAADTIVPGIQRVNSFGRYQFAKPVPLSGGSVFYIGIIPNGTNPIPIGFDKNNNYYKNMFRYVEGSFNQWFVFAGALDHDFAGSLMIHPVFGSYAQTLSIKDYALKNKVNFTLYPNPAGDQVTIKSEDNIAKVVVTDILGNLILQETSTAIKTINTLSLQSGVYLIKAFTDKGFADTQKLIIAR